MPIVPIRIEPKGLPGDLGLPTGKPRGIVIFAHGSGSSRLSPRNRFVARELEGAGLATLLFDLLSEDEAEDRANVFDIPLLAERLGHAIAWTRRHNRARALPIGLFGASTGAAAALAAAARVPEQISAVVSRGGRPDLAGADLPQVRAPTLLIVGGLDTEVLALNKAAKVALHCKIAIVPGATHLFEEPGTLERVVELARDWFVHHLVPADK
jgi:putative phosphoribosyl transferase